MTTLPAGVALCASSTCRKCGRAVKHNPHGGPPQARHLCWLRWLPRIRFRAHVEGWSEGYEFGVRDGRRGDSRDLDLLSRINRARCSRWHDAGEPWTASDWSNALAGETGELCNVIKKIRRHETGLGETSYNTPAMAALMDAAKDEIADTFLYLDLVANHLGLSLYECIKPKFDRVSKAQGFPERMP